MDKKDGEVPATPCFNAEEEAACAYRQARGSCYCGFGVFVSFGLLFAALELFGVFPNAFMPMQTVLFVLLMFLPLVMAVAAIVLGRSALILIGPGSEEPTARRSAVFGLALGGAGFFLWMLPLERFTLSYLR